MALEYGFYDSYNGDRKYNAQNMNDIFEGILTDGVYAGVGDEFFVRPGKGLQAIVGTGRAWFKMTWNKNRVMTPIEFDQPDPVYTRIDTVCIRARQNVLERVNDIYIYKGSIREEAGPPDIEDEAETYYLPIANVSIRPNATDIKASDIEILVGKERCPYVTSILQQTDITKLFDGWDEDFHVWLEEIKDELSHFDVGEVIVKLREMVSKKDKAVEADLNPASDEKWMTPATTKKMIDDASSEFKGGVTSFNGRTGDIIPKKGDYTSEDVGALPTTGGTLTGDLAIGSSSSKKNLTVTGTGSIGGTLSATGSTTLNDTLTVAKAATLKGTVTIQNGTSSYGGVLRFYDSNVQISESSSNVLEIKAPSIKLTTTTSLTHNGAPLGGLTITKIESDSKSSGSAMKSYSFSIYPGNDYPYLLLYVKEINAASVIIPWTDTPIQGSSDFITLYDFEATNGGHYEANATVYSSRILLNFNSSVERTMYVDYVLYGIK